MSKPSEARLGAFLREVSNYRWSEFIVAERDPKYTSNQAIIFALVRSCAMQNLQAIKLSINRLDGKLATPVKIEYPKIFYLYPNARITTGATKKPKALKESKLVVAEPVAEQSDLPSLSIRDTIAKMSDYPRHMPEQVSDWALMVEQWMNGNGPKPPEDPMVKSVVAAHLLQMAQNRSIDALGEVFDSIDGKLSETFQILGEDLFIVSYSNEAPEGAMLNDDGVLQLEATQVQDMWATRLGRQ